MIAWDNDKIQFARLLTEISANCDIDLGVLSEVMDLPVYRVNTLFDRAHQVFESAKNGAHFRIAGHIDDGQRLYWSNTYGWVDRDSADIFQSMPTSLPVGTSYLEPLV